MTFIEPHPDVVQPNPGGADDPLGESVLDAAAPWLRVFEPRDVRLVIGRGQDPGRELRLAQVAADRIPVHRRLSGGGTVVLAPGMVVVAMRLAPGAVDPTAYFAVVNQPLAAAVESVTGLRPLTVGHGDLALAAGDQPPRKVLGASLRQTAALTLWLGVFLVDDAVPHMERWLAPPSREPDYRHGRGHRAFCTHLGAHGANLSALAAAIRERCSEQPSVRRA